MVLSLTVIQGTALLVSPLQSESPGTHPYHDLFGHEKSQGIMQETEDMGADLEVGTVQERSTLPMPEQ